MFNKEGHGREAGGLSVLKSEMNKELNRKREE